MDYKSDIARSARKAWDTRKMDAIRRWGSLERLAASVSVETNQKFCRAAEKWNAALQGSDEMEVARRAGVMERGVDALEEEAIKAGKCPSDLTWFDLDLELDGAKCVGVFNPSEAEYVATTLSESYGKKIVVYTAADIVLMAHEGKSVLHHLKHAATAYTTNVKTGQREDAPW